MATTPAGGLVEQSERVDPDDLCVEIAREARRPRGRPPGVLRAVEAHHDASDRHVVPSLHAISARIARNERDRVASRPAGCRWFALDVGSGHRGRGRRHRALQRLEVVAALEKGDEATGRRREGTARGE